MSRVFTLSLLALLVLPLPSCYFQKNQIAQIPMEPALPPAVGILPEGSSPAVLMPQSGPIEGSSTQGSETQESSTQGSEARGSQTLPESPVMPEPETLPPQP